MENVNETSIYRYSPNQQSNHGSPIGTVEGKKYSHSRKGSVLLPGVPGENKNPKKKNNQTTVGLAMSPLIYIVIQVAKKTIEFNQYTLQDNVVIILKEIL